MENYFRAHMQNLEGALLSVMAIVGLSDPNTKAALDEVYTKYAENAKAIEQVRAKEKAEDAPRIVLPH